MQKVNADIVERSQNKHIRARLGSTSFTFQGHCT